MSQSRAILCLIPLLAAGSGWACGHPESEATAASAPAPASGESPSRFTAPLPSHTSALQEPQTLPPGHPPLPATGAAGTLPPPAPGAGTGAQGLVWSKPKGWVEEPPSSGMRRAQYRIPGGKGEGSDAECVVYYFGPGQGGSAEDNAQRWISQFTQGDGQPAKASLMQTTESNGVTVLRVEVGGTYSGGGPGMGSGPAKPGQRLLGAIATGPDANWFFKLTGPEATVRAQKAVFEAMISSLRKGS